MSRHAKGAWQLLPDGSIWSPSEWGEFQRRYSLLYQTVKNGAVEMGRRCTVPSADSTTGYFYALNIPAGRRFWIWRRDLVLSEGVYEVDLVSAPSGYSGGNAAFTTKLSQGAPSTVNTEVLCGVTPNDTEELETVQQLPRVDTGEGVGNRRVAGAASIDGALKSFTGGDVLLRVRRTTAAEFFTSLFLIAWEEQD